MAGKLRRACANKHRRGPSTPRHKILCYVIDLRRRFAQDDASLEGIQKHRVGCKKHEKIEKVTSSRDDNSVAQKVPKRSDERLLIVPQNCHPDRSEAQWRDLLFLSRVLTHSQGPTFAPPADPRSKSNGDPPFPLSNAPSASFAGKPTGRRSPCPLT